jgi:hypothetical protein
VVTLQFFDVTRVRRAKGEWYALAAYRLESRKRTDMKVFISYGGAADQVTALRLQALGAVNGLTVYVPPAHTRQGLPTLLDLEAAQKL